MIWDGTYGDEGKPTKVVKPISPSEIGSYKAKVIPSFVFKAVNKLLALNFVNGKANIKQDDITQLAFEISILESGIDEVQDYSSKLTAFRAEAAKVGWLNFESAYEEQGWKVTYDKPAYNESYDASFEFKVK